MCLLEWIKLKKNKLTTLNAGKDVEKLEFSCITVEIHLSDLGEEKDAPSL